jgi:uncharacterized protein
MAGKIGLTGVFVISIVGFAAIVLLSRVWLHYFAFGPLEWGWRCLTYQKIFPLRKAS